MARLRDFADIKKSCHDLKAAHTEHLAKIGNITKKVYVAVAEYQQKIEDMEEAANVIGHGVCEAMPIILSRWDKERSEYHDKVLAALGITRASSNRIVEYLMGDPLKYSDTDLARKLEIAANLKDYELNDKSRNLEKESEEW